MGTPAHWRPTKLRRDAPRNSGVSHWTRLPRGAYRRTRLSSPRRTRSALRCPELHALGVLSSTPVRRKKLRAARRASAFKYVLDIRTTYERERLQYRYAATRRRRHLPRRTTRGLPLVTPSVQQ
jgi:hypothetical protein